MRTKCLILFASLSLFYTYAFSQIKITGSVTDEYTGEIIIGANILLKDSYRGTISKPSGKFELFLDEAPPFMLVVSALGYKTDEYLIEGDDSELDIYLIPAGDEEGGVIVKARKVEREVQAASKLLESTVNAPVAVQKLGLLSLRDLPTENVFQGLAYLPEVQVSTSGMSYAFTNTRGFADAQNFRFVQQVDGVEIVSPGLNYTIPNLFWPSELDLSHVELIAGPGSALYGPNVFNGALSTFTRNPFDHEGVSAFVKGGLSIQKDVGTQPYREIGIRIAKAFSRKVAFKVNVAYMGATDWQANDDSHALENVGFSSRDELLERPRSHPNFNAVNRYGDEFQIPVLGDSGNVFLVNRSGLAEKDLLDYRINNLKLNAAIHWNISKKIQAIYDAKVSIGDAIIRHSVAIPLRDYFHQSHKLEFRSNNSFLRAYYIGENLNNSYNSLSAANFVQDQLKSNLIWGTEYGIAYRGEIAGLSGVDHALARAYADRDIPTPNTPEFKELLALSIANPNLGLGGSKYGGKSNLIHVDANYEVPYSPLGLQIQLGGSYRKYTLNSEGTLFNDGIDGFNAPIPFQEFGAYVQLIRYFAEDRIKVQLSERFDKNENYKGAFVPRASLVLSLDNEKKHLLRFSYQTGFRNPASLESFSRFNSLTGNLMGGTRKNIENYNYRINDTTLINGQEIFQQLFTLPSFQAFQASGFSNPDLLELANLDYLQPERVFTLSAGYSGKWGKDIDFHVNAYRNRYRNFVFRYLGYSEFASSVFAVYTNLDEEVTSVGVNTNFTYRLPGNFMIRGNYDFLNFNADSAISKNPGFVPGFNSPKHRAFLTLDNRNVYKGLGFSLRYRWSDAYVWQSLGVETPIDAYGQMDAAFSYRIESIKSLLKVGGSNILGSRFRTTNGGPFVGSLYYVSITIDEFSWEE
ncbi:MAG: TonB-dependent receptor [Bacteroidota bacterium]